MSLPARKLFSKSRTAGEEFSLKSDKKIISDFKSRIAFTFLSCFGQDVEMFRELQFWALKLRQSKIFKIARARGPGAKFPGFT